MRAVAWQVRETFMVAAQLRLPASMTAAEKGAVVQEVINELGLVKAAETMIGNQYVARDPHECMISACDWSNDACVMQHTNHVQTAYAKS